MNKSELIREISGKAEISIADAERVLNAFISSVSTELAEGGEVALLGFGTFLVKERSARLGRNPRTGEPMQIEAAKVASFRVGKALREAVSS